MYVIGIDPGLKGAFCLMKSNTIQSILPMPLKTINNKDFIDIKFIKNWLLGIIALYSVDRVLIEKQMVISKQGLSSSGKTMYQFGLLEGLIEGLDLEPIVIRPKEWQDIIFPQVDLDNLNEYNYALTKLKSIGFVEQKFSKSYLFTTSRQKKPSDGIADAICIASAGFSYVPK